jgi:hypothetical protein
VEWFIQLSDEIEWEIEDKNTGAPRAKVLMPGGRRRRDAGGYPPPGVFAQALHAAQSQAPALAFACRPRLM